MPTGNSSDMFLTQDGLFLLDPDGIIMGGRLSANGFFLMVVSACLFGIADVMIKSLSLGVPPVEIAFSRFLVGGIVLLFVLLPRRRSLKGNRTWILLVRGVAGTVTFLSLLKSISMIPLGNAMVLLYTFPVFAAFFSVLLLRESLTRGEILLVAVGVVGIYVLLGPGSHRFNAGELFGLLAGCFAGFTVVLIRKLRETNGPLIIYFYYCLVGGVLTFPALVKDFEMPDFEQFVLLIAVAVIFMIAQLLMTEGFKYCKASEGSVILMLEVVFAGIGGIVFFRDSLSSGFLVGTLMVMGSGAGLNLMHRRLRRFGVALQR
ncbi:MAG: DMT family transporter [Deltaproteobacteria bacterium]|nr:DMT family transporter [Deltaproteobacteria bacterium]MBW2121622.1 DMT family transporter [Deltaproteobacteria bacterium]